MRGKVSEGKSIFHTHFVFCIKFLLEFTYLLAANPRGQIFFGMVSVVLVYLLSPALFSDVFF